MAYAQFTLLRVQTDLGLTLESVPDLFPAVPAVPVPVAYRESVPAYMRLANTEAGRTHYLIAPLLGHVWLAGNGRIALFPGTRFDVDAAAELVGVCDFILGRPPQVNYVTGPVLMVVEAKNEDIWGGTGQCAAEMVAAQRFNAGRLSDITTIYGAVSDGERWRFLRLRDETLVIEMADRLVSDMDLIFGILLHICCIAPAAA